MASNTKDTRKPPIFVMGCQRSGTSALWKALCQHKNLRQKGPEDDGRPTSTTKELWCLREFFLGRQANPHRPHAGTQLDEEFKRRFGKLVDEFYFEKYAGPSGRWISAHPADGLFLSEILELFPEAKVLYLLRHPQEVVWSAQHAPWAQQVNRAQFLLNSAESARYWKKHGLICLDIIKGKYGCNVKIVKHKDMLTNPELVAREILEHVGEEFCDEVAFSLKKVSNSSFEEENQRSQLLLQVKQEISKDPEFCDAVFTETRDIMDKLGFEDLSGRNHVNNIIRNKIIVNELTMFFQCNIYCAQILYRIILAFRKILDWLKFQRGHK